MSESLREKIIQLLVDHNITYVPTEDPVYDRVHYKPVCKTCGTLGKDALEHRITLFETLLVETRAEALRDAAKAISQMGSKDDK